MRESETVDLGTAADELVAEAAAHHSGRAARLVVSGPRMRAVLMALDEGAELAEHDSPPAATLHVLRGSVVLRAGEASWTLPAGHLHPIPAERHSVLATSAAVMLLTVALAP